MIQTRPMTRDEVPAAHAVWARSAEHDPLSLSAFTAMIGDDGRPWVARQSGELVGLAVGALWPVAGDVRGSVRMLAVAPEARRHGVASALVDAVGADLDAQGATVLRLGECAPLYLTPGVDERLEAGLAFAHARGFHEIGRSVHLGVDLGSADWDTEADEGRLAEAGVSVRHASASDRPVLGALLDAHWPAWHPEAEIALAKGTLHLATRDGSALGFAAHSAIQPERGWFGPMGTAPEARGLGIGAVLLLRCLADLRDAGHDHATIAWAAALPFYERTCGALPERRFIRFERPL